MGSDFLMDEINCLVFVSGKVNLRKFVRNKVQVALHLVHILVIIHICNIMQNDQIATLIYAGRAIPNLGSRVRAVEFPSQPSRKGMEKPRICSPG
jgi:hypothetical protein